MDAMKAEIINQLRELNVLLIQSKLHVGRSKLAHHFHRDEADTDIPAFHSQGRLLSMLGLTGGSSKTSQRDLGYILGMSRQAISDMLSKLELKGLIVRRSSDTATGTMEIALTSKGRQTVEHMQEDSDTTPDILDCLNAEELAQFDGYLRRIIDNAEGKCANDEFAERRRAMHEFFSLTHPEATDDEMPGQGTHVQVERTVERTAMEGGAR